MTRKIVKQSFQTAQKFQAPYLCQDLISEIGNEAQTLEKLSQSETLVEKDANDSLNRMNQSLEKLIQEAETSLNTHLTLDTNSYTLKRSSSCPRFTTTILPQTRRKSDFDISSMQQDFIDKQGQIQLQQQQRRYLHSQWKLAMAMKQLIQTHLIRLCCFHLNQLKQLHYQKLLNYAPCF
ncbi:hypothetical protein BD770DRAFT_408313 [Pilaira anomala]|nr:hypothetical protein BD770DRAFT_408313 [Pilaira anomala]